MALHIPKVTPQSWQSDHQVTQSHPQIPKLTPKRAQSDPKVVRLGGLQTFPGVPVASVTSKILRKNEYNLFMDPFGADHDTIKPATTHIIPAIRRLYAQSGSKMTSKWTQSHPHIPKVIPKQPQINPKFSQSFYKIINICTENECFLKTDLYIPKVTLQ